MHVGQFTNHGEALNFENSMRHSDIILQQDATHLQQVKGHIQPGYFHPNHRKGGGFSDGDEEDEDGAHMMIRPDEEQHENALHNEDEYDVQVESGEDVVEDEDDDDENCIEIDERTLIAIIKVQALIRGFLTRKMIFEHLQRMV